MYDAATNSSSSEATTAGVQIMSIDNLPAEIPLESSNFFSTALYPHIVKVKIANTACQGHQ